MPGYPPGRSSAYTLPEWVRDALFLIGAATIFAAIVVGVVFIGGQGHERRAAAETAWWQDCLAHKPLHQCTIEARQLTPRVIDRLADRLP
jgi:hypothetical protein